MVEIPKYPEVPHLSATELDHVEEVVFGPPQVAVPPRPRPSAAMVFGGTHPGAWLATLQSHRDSPFERIFVTGGHKGVGVPHHKWTYGTQPEADVIQQKLLEGGVEPHRIVLENTSENSKDNILNIRELILAEEETSVLLVCRSYAVGRQTRTFQKHVGEIRFEVLSYETDLNALPGRPLGRHNWREQDPWRSVVWGEYLRIVEYGRRGDLAVNPPSQVSVPTLEPNRDKFSLVGAKERCE